MNRARPITIAIVAIAAFELTTASSALAEALKHWPRQCRSDIGRACRTVAKDEDKVILTCLQENETKLSQACRKLLQSYGHVPDSAGKRR